MEVNVESYLERKAFAYKKSGTQFQVEVCPLCNDLNWHFYINSDHGAWDCKICGESGSYFGLLKKLGDLKIKNFQKTEQKSFIKEPDMKREPATTNYIIKWRKISQEMVDKFTLICEKDKVGFVYRDGNGSPYLIKWRSILGHSPYTEPKGRAISYPFNYKNFNTLINDYVILCEGEIDAITWTQYGYENVMALSGANSFKHEWLELLDRYKIIYLNLDQDPVGNSAKEKLIKKLGSHRCRIIKTPFKDINDCLKNGLVKKEIDEIFNEAEQVKNETLVHASEIDLFTDTGDDIGISTGWPMLDDLTKWRVHELTIFTADTKNGKTTFTLNCIKNQIENNLPCLVGSFEIGMKSSQKIIASQMLKKSFWKFADSDKTDYKNFSSRLPLYYVDNYGSMSIDELRDNVIYAVKYLGVKFILLDHLHFFSNLKSDNLAFELGKIIKEIKLWTMQLDIHIFLIVHPGNHASDQKVTEHNLRGSSDIKQTCDNVFRVQADKENMAMELTLLIKRHPLAREGDVYFSYDNESLSFIQSERSIKKEELKKAVRNIRNIFEPKSEND